MIRQIRELSPGPKAKESVGKGGFGATRFPAGPRFETLLEKRQLLGAGAPHGPMRRSAQGERSERAAAQKAGRAEDGTRGGDVPVPLAVDRVPYLDATAASERSVAGPGGASGSSPAQGLELVSRMAMAADGSLRLEFGTGSLRGAVVVVRARGKRVALELEGASDVASRELLERARRHLKENGVDVEE